MAAEDRGAATRRLASYARRVYGSRVEEALATSLGAVPGLPLADRQDPERTLGPRET